MVATNDITGDAIITSPVNQAYRDNYDKVFGNKINDTEEIEDVYAYLMSIFFKQKEVDD